MSELRTPAPPARRAALAAALIAVGGAIAASVAPAFSLLLLAVSTAVAAAARRPVIAAVALVVAGPLESAVTLPGALAPLGLSRLATGYALVALLGHALFTRHHFRGDRGYLPAVLLACLAALAAAASPEPGTSWASAARYVGVLVLMVVVSEHSEGHRLRTVMWAYVTVTAAVTIPALMAFATGAETLVRTPTADPNDFAVLMAVALPMAALLIGPATTRRALRLVALACLAVLGLGVLLTLSRGAALALVIGTLWHLGAEPRHRRALVGGLTLIGALVVAAGVRLAPLVAEALTRKDVSADDNVASRLSGWRLAVELALDHPALGIGPGLFGRYYRDGTDTPLWSFGLEVTHNTYLGVLAEAGLPAFLVLVCLLGLTWARLSALRAAPELGPGEQDVAAILRTSLLVGMIASVFSNQEYASPLWLLFGLTGALAARRPLQRQRCCP